MIHHHDVVEPATEPATEPAVEPSAEAPRRGVGARATVLGVVAAAVVLVGAIVAAGGGGSGDRSKVRAELPSADRTGPTTLPDLPALEPGPVTVATTAAPAPAARQAAPSPTPVPVGADGRTQVLAVADRWALFFTAGDRCLELVLREASYPRLLCGAGAVAPGDLVGTAVTVDSPIGRLVVATVEPRVTGFSAYPRAGGAIHHDGAAAPPPADGGVAFAVGTVGPGWIDLKLRAGDQQVGTVLLPSADRTYAPGELQRTSGGAVYGDRPGYRKAANTGFFFGGDQEVGFYDGPDGAPCGLYRRFGGEAEGVIADGCIAAAGGALQVATLQAVPAAYGPNGFMIFAVTNVVDPVLVVELPDGTRLPSETSAYADPRGTGWFALAQNARWFDLPAGVASVDFVIEKAGSELARETVAVPGR